MSKEISATLPLTAYALPDARLHGFLAAAMIIEMTWFLRHRRTGERRLHALGDHDLLVLKTQAKGDIEGFAETAWHSKTRAVTRRRRQMARLRQGGRLLAGWMCD